LIIIIVIIVIIVILPFSAAFVQCKISSSVRSSSTTSVINLRVISMSDAKCSPHSISEYEALEVRLVGIPVELGT
jgi:hypothetical protein